MTNRDMVKIRPGSAPSVEPNTPPLPPMPAPEDSPTPTTREEPVDSPHLNASLKRPAPGPGEQGLSTKR
ncbi:hypothetical protein WYO_5660 [Methylobacterium sp. GXF4]|jgi:hypothetical protein|uniref:hypothetical protein n=1 Tax=Methylobacterium TaxID=407 RepID=UPI000269871D|nr:MULTISPECIES: hypothetical protein [Methylobacterium]AYO85189.1 hypothetical protein EBB05_25180 [Methylobacterium brachiatum]EIZ81733.1 hypothetical protein WYO_5660 [Methylobacterium sp. GXF4]MDF2602084.1 hypothetical protein [Methylobacterium brachiatum]CAA2157754.1 hypothetical protein MBRA_03121 [Methylobacterium brachiatum]